MYQRARYLFLLLFVLMTKLSLANNYIVEQDLRYSLTYYDKFKDTFLPLELSSIKRDVVYIHFDIKETEGRFFRMIVKQDLDLFINEQLVDQYNSGDTLLMNIKDYESKYDQRFDVSIHSKYGDESFEGPWIVLEGNQFDINKKVDKDGVGVPYFKSDDSFYYLLLIFGVLLIAYLRFSKSPYLDAYFNLSHYVSRFGVDDYVILNPINGQSILLWSVVSLFYSLGLNYLGFYWLGSSQFLNIFIGLIVFFGSFFLKYFVLVLLNSLYGDIKVVRGHYFEYVRFASLIGLVSGLLVLMNRDYYVLMFVIFGSILFTAFIISLLSKLNYKRMYLISYLCVSEILPFILLVKLMSNL